MNALEKFLADSGMSKSEFAKSVGITPGRVSQLLNNPNERPGRDLIARIEEATGGAVTFRDWVSPPLGRGPTSDAA